MKKRSIGDLAYSNPQRSWLWKLLHKKVDHRKWSTQKNNFQNHYITREGYLTMVRSNLKYLKRDVKLCEARIDKTPANQTDALEYWFEHLDLAKKNLLMYGKLEVVANDQ
ncbi:hypothetical protein IWT25_02327 [Secundilactobacillus pentosiphilus]|uniref:Uncharacterized protein n=1 Tax=Secundilactobacillus pentosiphilus TaxID=1714682 RepID=A0A1Z5IZ96_9LACO|nr:hypothetical protein [Secundilactobacillus pentosiphilus]GAX06979.1 hypothetical protein IWT25_02327 [Secundilactobacillus pentosiphilus]